jgi:tRNA(Glu) U13 pseudouridine synthase TruD
MLVKILADTGRYVNTLTTINQAIRDDFIKAYRDILKNSDPSKIAEMNKSIAREIKKIATSTVIDKQKEMDIASLTAKLRNKKVV